MKPKKSKNENIQIKFHYDTREESIEPWMEVKDMNEYAICRISQYYNIDKILNKETEVIQNIKEPIDQYSLHLFLFDKLSEDDETKIKLGLQKAHKLKFHKNIKNIKIDYEIVPKFDFDQKFADKKLAAI